MKNKSNKIRICIIGAGYVGSSAAFALTLRGAADEISLIDTDREKARGEALDIRHGIFGIPYADVYAGGYEDCKNGDIIVICAGRGRKPGESRLDLAQSNIAIMNDVTDSIKPYYNGCPVIVVSNPNDIMTLIASQRLGAEKGRVFGTGCILDSSRLTSCIADCIGADINMIEASVAGEHGDAQVPLWSGVLVSDMPVGKYCDINGINWNDSIKKEISQKVLTMGSDIIKRKGKTHYGIAECVCALADMILNDRKAVVSVSSPLDGEYGISGISLSVRSVIGSGGVEKILTDELADSELKGLRESADKLLVFLKSLN